MFAYVLILLKIGLWALQASFRIGVRSPGERIVYGARYILQNRITCSLCAGFICCLRAVFSCVRVVFWVFGFGSVPNPLSIPDSILFVREIFQLWFSVVKIFVFMWRSILREYFRFYFRINVVLFFCLANFGDVMLFLYDLPRNLGSFVRNLSYPRVKPVLIQFMRSVGSGFSYYMVIQGYCYLFLTWLFTVLIFVSRFYIASPFQRFLMFCFYFGFNLIYGFLSTMLGFAYESSFRAFMTELPRSLDDLLEFLFESINMRRARQWDVWDYWLWGDVDARVYTCELTWLECLLHPFSSRTFRSSPLLLPFGVSAIIKPHHIFEPAYLCFGALVSLGLIEWIPCLDRDNVELESRRWRVVVVTAGGLSSPALLVTSSSDPRGFTFDAGSCPKGLLIRYRGDVTLFCLAEWHASYYPGGVNIHLYEPYSEVPYLTNLPAITVTPGAVVFDMSDSDNESDMERDILRLQHWDWMDRNAFGGDPHALDEDDFDEIDDDVGFHRRDLPGPVRFGEVALHDWIRPWEADVNEDMPALVNFRDPDLQRVYDQTVHMADHNWYDGAHIQILNDDLAFVEDEPEPEEVPVVDDEPIGEVAAGPPEGDRSLLLEALENAIASLPTKQFDVTSIVRLCGVITNMLHSSMNPIAVVSVLVAAYPGVCVAFWERAVKLGLQSDFATMRDLLTALITPDEKFEVEPVAMVAAGPSEDDDSGFNLVKLVDSLRKEFVGRLVMDEIVGSVIGVNAVFKKWVDKYVMISGGSVTNFIDGVLSSVLRMIAHIRYYLDGDLALYLKSLDPEAAAMYRFSVIEDHYTQRSYDHDLLVMIDEEIPRFERLITKIRATSNTYKTVLQALSVMRIWRVQCFARLNEGDLPVVIAIVGPERCGKSELAEEAKILPAKHERVPLEKIHVSRPRNSDKFDTELSPASDVVLFQDSFRDATPHDMREIMNLFFDMAGGQCIPLTKAALEEKGQYMAPPKMIILSSNDTNLRFDSGAVLKNHKALGARIKYAVVADWPSDPERDPERLLVTWSLGTFDSIEYDKGGHVPYDFKTASFAGTGLTKAELLDRLQVAYGRHQNANQAYRLKREKASRQCKVCFGYEYQCTCTSDETAGCVASGPPVFVSVSNNVFGDGLLYYLVSGAVLFQMVQWIVYFSMKMFMCLHFWNLADRCLIFLASKWKYLTTRQRSTYVEVGEYVSTLPAFIKDRQDQLTRLDVRRRKTMIVTAVCCALTALAVAFYQWRKTRVEPQVAVYPISFDKSGVPYPAPNPVCTVMPGVPIVDRDRLPPEMVCGRLTTSSGAMNFIRLDDHSLFTVSHLLPGEGCLVRPLDYHVLAPCRHPDKMIPEMCTLSRENDAFVVSTVKTLKFPQDVRPKFGVYTPALKKQLYVSGYEGNAGDFHRVTIPPEGIHLIERPTRYFDARDKQYYVINPGEGCIVDVLFPSGSCSSVLHDGEFIYGYVVANMTPTKQSFIRLFPPGGVSSFKSSSETVVGPIPPPKQVPLSDAFVARGMPEMPMHARSAFKNERVTEFWDYKCTVVDESHMHPRARRVRGPHADAFAALSGIPVASILEATGASGVVPGVTHKVSPMEHFFEKHKASQAVPAPYLDEDFTDLKLFLDDCVSKIEVRYKSPLTTQVALHGDGEIKPMAFDKSAGYPSGEKRDLMSRGPNGEIIAGVALENALDTAYQEFLDGKCMPPIYRPFPKQGELISAAKVLSGENRIIMNNLSFVQSVVIRRIMLPVLLNLIVNRKIFGMLVGLSATNPEHVKDLAESVGFSEGRKKMPADHNKFDLHEKARLAALVMHIIIRTSIHMGYDEAHVRAVRYVCYLWLYPIFVYRGDVWQAEANIWGSGTLGTEVFQSLCAWLLHMVVNVMFIREKLGVDFAPLAHQVDMHKKSGVLVYGDDNHRNDFEGAPSGEFVQKIVNGCGYHLTDNLDKTIPPQYRDDFSMLKRTIKLVRYEKYEFLTMPLEVKSIVKSLYWPMKGLDGKVNLQVYGQCLINANTEAFLHGQEFFNEWHPLFVKAFVETQTVGNPPVDWRELLEKYNSGILQSWDSGGQLPI